jgi:hypothetical protein
VQGTALNWFQSYLSGRHFSVKFVNFRSQPQPLHCGVPQGSVLGPIIFNMYTKPLEDIIVQHNLIYHKYADDMQLYGIFNPASVLDCARVKHAIEQCLVDVRRWMLLNMLKSKFKLNL